jgi:hypothetical protein
MILLIQIIKITTMPSKQTKKSKALFNKFVADFAKDFPDVKIHFVNNKEDLNELKAVDKECFMCKNGDKVLIKCKVETSEVTVHYGDRVKFAIKKVFEDKINKDCPVCFESLEHGTKHSCGQCASTICKKCFNKLWVQTMRGLSDQGITRLIAENKICFDCPICRAFNATKSDMYTRLLQGIPLERLVMFFREVDISQLD